VVGRLHVPEDAVLAPTTRFDADVVLFDLPGPGRNGELEAAVEITRRCAPSRIVVLTDGADERSLFEALRGGIAGYLLKSLSGPELVEHLVRAGRGEIVMDPTMASKIALRAVRFGDGARWPGIEIGLSRRESEVLGHLVDGQSNREISETLVISQETVKTHLRSIYHKLRVKDRAQAVAAALRQGMIA
jgi:DNA-binding NarL/FixJ family response regulator